MVIDPRQTAARGSSNLSESLGASARRSAIASELGATKTTFLERPRYPGLAPDDRVTPRLWAHSHTEWRRTARGDGLAEMAPSAVLAGLHRGDRPEGPFDICDSSTSLNADLALVRSSLPDPRVPDEAMLRRLRATAFYLRWVELAASLGRGALQ